MLSSSSSRVCIEPLPVEVLIVVQHLLTSDTAAADLTIAGPVPELLAKLESGERLSPSEVSAYSLFMRGRVTEARQVFYQR